MNTTFCDNCDNLMYTYTNADNKLYNVYINDNYGKRVYLTTTDDFEKWLEESNKWWVADGIEPESADYFMVREANLQLFNK